MRGNTREQNGGGGGVGRGLVRGAVGGSGNAGRGAVLRGRWMVGIRARGGGRGGNRSNDVLRTGNVQLDCVSAGQRPDGAVGERSRERTEYSTGRRSEPFTRRAWRHRPGGNGVHGSGVFLCAFLYLR